MEFGTYPTGWYIEDDLPNQSTLTTRMVCVGDTTRLC